MARAPRLRKQDTDPDVWQAHRKLRKKLASAKWYAKKKEREIREQRVHRRVLEANLRDQERAAQEILRLHEARQQAYWRCVVGHHVHHYPVRPESVEPEVWCLWIDEVEAQLERTRNELRTMTWSNHVPWEDDVPGFTKILRQLGMRELRAGTPVEERWMCGIWGVLLAGCIRRYGGPLTGMPVWLAIRKAVCQTKTVHPTHMHSNHHTHPVHPPTAAPSTTPIQNDHHIDILRHWQRWIEFYVFPVDRMTGGENKDSQQAWYDTDEEEEWLREWELIDHSQTMSFTEHPNTPKPLDTSTSPPHRVRFLAHPPPTLTSDDEEDLPSSLDHLVDDYFREHPCDDDHPHEQHAIGSDDSTTNPPISCCSQSTIA